MKFGYENEKNIIFSRKKRKHSRNSLVCMQTKSCVFATKHRWRNFSEALVILMRNISYHSWNVCWQKTKNHWYSIMLIYELNSCLLYINFFYKLSDILRHVSFKHNRDCCRVCESGSISFIYHIQLSDNFQWHCT